MTFKHKLAKRLALEHASAMLTLLIAMAACQPGGTLKEGFALPDPTATLDTVLTAPETVTLQPGGTQQFMAYGRTGAGDSVAVAVRQWTASGGTVDATGLFRAGSTPGSFQISASAELVDGNPGQRQGRSTIQISQNPAQLTGITVAPNSVALAQGETRGFSATGQMSDGAAVAVTVTWSATGGTIDAGGFYTAGGSAGSFTVVATESSGLADTASVTVTAPPSGGPHPHEPAGFTRFAEYDFTTPLNHGIGNSNGTELDGCYWEWDPSNKLSIVSDPTAPTSPSGVLDVLFPNGMSSGVSPGKYQAWDTCVQHQNTEYSKLYVSLRIKLVGSNWESHPVLTKFLGFWGSGRNNEDVNASDMYGAIDGSGVASSWTFFWVNSHFPAGARRLSQNVNRQLRIRAGVWHHIELVMEMNSSPGSSDGKFKWWLDGILALDYNNVQYNSPSSPSGFYGRHYSPTWGGASVIPRSRDDHIYIDHEYMSGMP